MSRQVWRFAEASAAAPPPALDAAQQAAVDWCRGPGLVLAGPGTGKTSVLVESARARLAAGAPASSILLLTFGRDAAAELRQRLALSLGNGAPPRVSTFHGFALDLVMRVQDPQSQM